MQETKVPEPAFQHLSEEMENLLNQPEGLLTFLDSVNGFSIWGVQIMLSIEQLLLSNS